MPARFDDSLPYFGNEVIAIGPLHPTEKIKELCAWVYQQQGADDAAATEMTTNKAQPPNFQQLDGVRWLLSLEKISQTAFIPGRAFAVGVALMIDLNTGKERVTWWGQPVDLFENQAAVDAGNVPGALERPPLQNPFPFPPPPAV